MQIEEERADAAAMRIEKKLRRLQVAKQGDNDALVEAKRWLECIAYGMDYAGAADAAERSTKACEMIGLISKSVLRRCVRGLTLDERRAKLLAWEEACEIAGDELAVSLDAVARDLVAAVTAGFNDCGCDCDCHVAAGVPNYSP